MRYRREGRLVRGDAAAGGKESVCVRGRSVRGKRRAQGQHEVKLMFIDGKRAHFSAQCEEEEWVELPGELDK